MAKLKINELKVTGSELFEDSETFLTELTNEEIATAMGGRIYSLADGTRTVGISPYSLYSPYSPYSPVIL
ncbi:hypothetical protein NIES4074_40220 [Cylindrospermum sp. NIES-4074]|nr:hypothetical protein NIES4074_40220 [Cylindrospermum sp. NIES-4074]